MPVFLLGSIKLSRILILFSTFPALFLSLSPLNSLGAQNFYIEEVQGRLQYNSLGYEDVSLSVSVASLRILGYYAPQGSNLIVVSYAGTST